MDLDDLTHAQAAVGAVLADLGRADWGRPTPCDDWDVEAVARHLMVGERAFTTSLGGERYDLVTISADVTRIPVTDLPSAYAEGAAALRDAFLRADPAAAFPTGLGPMPAPPIAELRTIEALVHGWDVAQGAGRRLDVDDGVAERAIGHAVRMKSRLPPERRVFGEPQPVADDAPALDRLAAYLGRPVGGFEARR